MAESAATAARDQVLPVVSGGSDGGSGDCSTDSPAASAMLLIADDSRPAKDVEMAVVQEQPGQQQKGLKGLLTKLQRKK